MRFVRCGDRGEKHLGRARVAVLLEEVVLDLPHVVDAEPIRELALLERVLDQLVLGVLRPRARQRVLVEQSELHVTPLVLFPGSLNHAQQLRRRGDR